jgi:hypothetical protein
MKTITVVSFHFINFLRTVFKVDIDDMDPEESAELDMKEDLKLFEERTE